MRAEQLADAERRPRDQRPAPRGHDPELVGAAREQGADREGERDGEPDVAEVEQRRVGHHVRVLEARRQAAAVERRHLRHERRREHDDGEGEEDGDGAEHGHDPGDEVAGAAAVQEDRGGAVAGEDEQPEQERALLAAPEGRDRVAGRQLAARVGPDVDEREVVPDEGDDEHDRRDEGAAEGRDQRVLGRLREPPLAPRCGVRARDDRVEREPEGDDERRATELRHLDAALGPTCPARTSTGTS